MPNPENSNQNQPQEPDQPENNELLKDELKEVGDTIIFPEADLPSIPELAIAPQISTRELPALLPATTRVDLDEVLARPPEDEANFYRRANVHMDTIVLLPGHTEKMNNLDVGILHPEDVSNVEGNYITAIPAHTVLTRLVNISDESLRLKTTEELLGIFDEEARQQDLLSLMGIVEQMGDPSLLRGLVSKIRQSSAINTFLYWYKNTTTKKHLRSLPGENSPAYQNIQAGLAASNWNEAMGQAIEKGYLL